MLCLALVSLIHLCLALSRRDMLPPEEIIAQIELNPDGLALYRIEQFREISVLEARRLVEIGWAEPDVVRVYTADGVPTVFECIGLSLEGTSELADLKLASAPLTKRWGKRCEVSAFARAVLCSDPRARQRQRENPRVFHRSIFNITFQEGVDDLYSQSARGWYPGYIEEWPIEELKLRSYNDWAEPSGGTKPTSNQEDVSAPPREERRPHPDKE